MMKKFLKDVVTIVVGKQAEEIVEILSPNKYINEFLIAKKLNLTINQVRNILYRLSNHGLVSSIRKKNKKKGWYTYFWRIEIIKSLEFLRGIILKKSEQLNNQIKSRETKDFYICERCDIELSEENALLNDFTCKECGGVFSIKDKIKVLKELKKEVDKLNRDLAFIDGELKIEKGKENKRIAKETKKFEKAELKIKTEKRLQAKIKRALAKTATKSKEKKVKKKKK